MSSLSSHHAVNSTTAQTTLLESSASPQDEKAIGLNVVSHVFAYGQVANLAQSGSPSIDLAGQSLSASNAVQRLGRQQRNKKKKVKKPSRTNRVQVREQKNPGAYLSFRRLCDELLVQVRELETMVLDDGLLADGWEGPAVEIRSLLLRMRTIPWGMEDSLKRWVSAVYFQVANASWDKRHVGMLGNAGRTIRARYSVDTTAVDECQEIIRAQGLDPFRGTASEPVVQNRYKVVADKS